MESGAYTALAASDTLPVMLYVYVVSAAGKGIDRPREGRQNAGLHAAAVAWGPGRWTGCVEG